MTWRTTTIAASKLSVSARGAPRRRTPKKLALLITAFQGRSVATPKRQKMPYATCSLHYRPRHSNVTLAGCVAQPKRHSVAPVGWSPGLHVFRVTSEQYKIKLACRSASSPYFRRLLRASSTLLAFYLQPAHIVHFWLSSHFSPGLSNLKAQLAACCFPIPTLLLVTLTATALFVVSRPNLQGSYSLRCCAHSSPLCFSRGVSMTAV